MNLRAAALGLIIASGIASAATAVPASADEIIVVGHRVPVYESWQSGWDRREFDRRHVMLGEVAGFEPYRLQIARRDGNVQTIDLKNGTVILPTGATPRSGERVAVVGYYSQGTFIANRVLLRR